VTVFREIVHKLTVLLELVLLRRPVLNGLMGYRVSNLLPNRNDNFVYKNRYVTPALPILFSPNEIL